MKKYKVVYALSYTIEAEDENDAEEKSLEFFREDCNDIDLFGVNVETLN